MTSLVPTTHPRVVGVADARAAPSPGIGEMGLVGDQASRLRALVERADSSRTPASPSHVAAQRVVAHAPPVSKAAGAKIIAVASGKGGVGKTNLAVNLAIAMTAQGCRVTLLDADLGTANADVLCGLMPGHRLDEFIRAGPDDTRGLRDIAIPAPGGFRLVPGSAGIARMADLPPMQRLRLIQSLGELESDADALIIDTAAGVGSSVTSFLRIADLALIVTTPEPPAIADAYALIKCLSTGGAQAGRLCRQMALLVNQVTDFRQAESVHRRITGVAQRFLNTAPAYAGWISADPHVPAAVRVRQPFSLVHPASTAAREVQDLATRIIRHLGVHRGLADSSERHPSRLRRLLARILRGEETGASPEFLKRSR